MASVLGTGPVAITTDNATHLTIPLSALTANADGSITIGGWPPGGSPPDALAKANDWVAYLLKENELQPFTPVGTAPAGDAFLVEAVHPGASGNSIAFTISPVTVLNPPNMSTMDITVTVTDVYEHLTLDNLADKIGTAVDGGSEPGLIHLVTPPAPPPTLMPDDAQTVAFSAVGAVMQAAVMSGANTAFTLEAPGDGGGGNPFNVVVAVTSPTEFKLTINWQKTANGKTLADHVAEFAYVMNITAPPTGFGVPAAGPYTLATGADQDPTPTPAKPAKATVPST